MSTRTADRPTLAVCVPTHDGRAQTLDELLSRLAREPGAEQIEVCVGDNASHDGTREVVDRHRSRFHALHYWRHERNHGMAVLRAIELASTDYCWLMGSDDAPAPGSVGRIRDLLDEHDGTSGLVVGHRRVSADNLEVPALVVAPEPYPRQRQVTRFRGLRSLTESLGYIFFWTSNQVIRRDLWAPIAESERRQVIRAGCAPHLYVIGRMAALAPDWVWCPEPLVLSREAPLYLMDADELGVGLGSVNRRICRDLDRVWCELYGARSYEYRALMYKALRHVWDPEFILYMRRQETGTREFAANALVARRFWWSRWFWRKMPSQPVGPIGPLRSRDAPPRWGRRVRSSATESRSR